MKSPSFLLDKIEKKTYGAMVLEKISNAEESYAIASEFREYLRIYGFSEKNCKKYLLYSLQDLPYFHYAHLAEILPQEPLGWILRLFVLEQSVPIAVLAQLFSPQVVKWLLELGLFTVTENRILSRVLIFPVEGCFFVTDHRWQHDTPYSDRVMYIGKDTLGLHYVTPYRKLKGGVLDLCCGSGIQGILAARYASFVVGVDINPRAVRFSLFNAILNNIRNIAFYEGSLFEPICDGQKFDLILANPPFVPKKETEILFRDGGRTGEDVLSKIVQDSPQYLSEGACLCVATDLVNPKNYAKKLKKWLKNTSAKGLLIVEPYIKYNDYVVAHRLVLQEYRKQESSQQAWIRHLNQEGIDHIAPGFILLQKADVEGVSFQVCNINTTLEMAFNQEVKNFFYPKKSTPKYVALSKRVLATIDLSNQAEIALEGHALFGPCTVSLPVYRWLLSMHKSKVKFGDLTEAQRDIVPALVRHGVLTVT